MEAIKDYEVLLILRNVCKAKLKSPIKDWVILYIFYPESWRKIVHLNQVGTFFAEHG